MENRWWGEGGRKSPLKRGSYVANPSSQGLVGNRPSLPTPRREKGIMGKDPELCGVEDNTLQGPVGRRPKCPEASR